MNFELSDEQQQLADSLSKYLNNEYGFEQRKAILQSPSGLSDKAWAAFAEMGLTAIAVPEADGGFGGGAIDLMAAMEAFGEALVVEPLLDNVALAGRLVAKLGSAAQRAAMLPGLIDGSAQLAFACYEPGQRYALNASTTVAQQQGTGWTLNGAKCVVVGAATASALVVSANTGNGAVSLFVVDPKAAGVALNPSRTVDGQRVADVRFTGVVLGNDALLGAPGAALPAI